MFFWPHVVLVWAADWPKQYIYICWMVTSSHPSWQSSSFQNIKPPRPTQRRQSQDVGQILSSVYPFAPLRSNRLPHLRKNRTRQSNLHGCSLLIYPWCIWLVLWMEQDIPHPFFMQRDTKTPACRWSGWSRSAGSACQGPSVTVR